MSNNVFPANVQYSMEHTLEFASFTVSMGDGFEQRVNKNLAYNRADGEGNVSSYKGVNRFRITVNKLAHINYTGGNRAPATALWNFYKSMLGSYDSFYFYNPAEGAIDTGGNNTTGRYRVRFTESALTREQFALQLFNHGIELIEVRE